MRRNMVPVFLLLVFVAACATTNITMTPKTRALMILSTYNTITAQTAAMSQRTYLTEAQKQTIRKKKAIILKLDPLVKSYGMIVANGGTPSLENEQEIYNLIDDLVALTPQ